jgi:hypothetical protein
MKIKPKVVVFLVTLIMVFVINGSLTALMTNEGFFFLNGTKIFIRIFIALMLTVIHGDKLIEIYAKIKKS